MTVTVGEGEEKLDVDFPLTVIPTPTPATTVAKVLARTGSTRRPGWYGSHGSYRWHRGFGG